MVVLLGGERSIQFFNRHAVIEWRTFPTRGVTEKERSWVEKKEAVFESSCSWPQKQKARRRQIPKEAEKGGTTKRERQRQRLDDRKARNT